LITGFFVSFFGLVISIILVNSRNNSFYQQILFILSSIILIVSPIIISLGYFIILGEWRYVNFVNFVVIIMINCIFLIPFAILILFTKLKNIYLNFSDIKTAFQISEKSFILIIYPLIKKNIFFVFSFSAALSFGDFTIISFFKNDNFQTLPSLLYKLVISYRFTEAAFVAGFILIFSLFIYLLFDNNIYKDKPDKSI
jgi:thiamine transport system permease protein